MSVLPGPSIQLARSMNISVDELPTMSAFTLFQNQMDSSVEASVDAMKRLSIVAYAMGKDEAVSKLIPYLTQLALQQPPYPDEILLLLGQQLVEVVDLIPKNHLPDLLPLLERLMAVEETVVREQAVLVCNELVLKSDDMTAFVGVAKRLGAADWFTAKVSACGMIAGVLKKQLNSELLQLYRELCHDDTPMVRRAAAKNLGHVLQQSGTQHLDFALHTLPVLMKDEQDSVRLLAASALANVGTVFGENNPQWTCQHWLPLIKEASTDMSWYVLLDTLRCMSSRSRPLYIVPHADLFLVCSLLSTQACAQQSCQALFGRCVKSRNPGRPPFPERTVAHHGLLCRTLDRCRGRSASCCSWTFGQDGGLWRTSSLHGSLAASLASFGG